MIQASSSNSRAKTATEELSNAALEKLSELRDSIEDYYEKGLHQARSLERNVEARIRRRPMQSVLIAAGVAAALGVFVGLACRR